MKDRYSSIRSQIQKELLQATETNETPTIVSVIAVGWCNNRQIQNQETADTAHYSISVFQ